MLLHDAFRDDRFEALASILPAIPMDHDFANAVINFALWRDPERVAEVIANVSCQLEARAIQPKKSRRPLTNCWTN
jgi:hypothetical protein